MKYEYALTFWQLYWLVNLAKMGCLHSLSPADLPADQKHLLYAKKRHASFNLEYKEMNGIQEIFLLKLSFAYFYVH